MKCDELKSLWVYSRDINENCDEEFVNFAKENGYEELVEKKEVTEAIAELKARIQLDDDEMEGFLQLEEECGGGDLRNYIAELKAELAEKEKDIAYWREEYDKETQLTDALKDEIESLKASHYAESVDAGMRERRLRRALYKVCAKWAFLAQWERGNLVENWEKWENVERKCRAKAEQYK